MRLLGQALAVGSFLLPALAADKPNVPLSSSNRWILDADEQRIKMRCINWAGHMEVNIPEGLHRQSVDYIADWVANEGFNCVRLTYSIDMALNPDVKVKESFDNAANLDAVDTDALKDLYTMATEKNSFLADASVRDVFGTVVDALWDRGVMTVLDNHVSKATWCCNLTDGNGWWSDAPIYSEDNSRYFDHQKWLDGLQAMAEWSTSRPGIVGMSLRNEMRATVQQIPFAANTWFTNIPPAARLIHAANPDVLVVVGGLNGGTDLSPLRDGTLDKEDWADKNVWEAHMYSYTVTTPNLGNCDIEKTEYGGLFGFVLEQDHHSVGPLWLSEFGVGMEGGDQDGLNKDDHDYLTCLVSYMEGNDADWSLWAIQGSYYIRDFQVDPDETWGALDFDWSGWRNPRFKSMLGGMFDVTQGP